MTTADEPQKVIAHLAEKWHEGRHIVYDEDKVYVAMPFYTAMQTVLFYGYTSYVE